MEIPRAPKVVCESHTPKSGLGIVFRYREVVFRCGFIAPFPFPDYSRASALVLFFELVSEKKAKDELKAARATASQRGNLPGVKLRAQLFGREVDEMLSAHQAHIPRADLHGEGTVV